MIWTSAVSYPPMRVKCIQRCSFAAFWRSSGIGAVEVMSHGSLGSLGAPALPEDVTEGDRDGNDEDRARDHVHLRRHRDAGDAPDEDRERLCSSRVEVRDHEV